MVVVLVIAAAPTAAPTAAGQPMSGTMELPGAAACTACRTVTGLREPGRPAADEN
ncbi:hypothetical protein KNE206_54130 [Kitasatospora sp. NE20-6]|uniref:hypothetical protein n=1 Tax=Kitasatospora sp. NE20-6 TaxID=2859066 RepID=UPI0034DBC265